MSACKESHGIETGHGVAHQPDPTLLTHQHSERHMTSCVVSHNDCWVLFQDLVSCCCSLCRFLANSSASSTGGRNDVAAEI